MNRGFIGALTLSVAFSMLAGCGGLQPPIGPTGAMPQSRAITHHKEVSNRASSNDELLYVTTSERILILTYPEGKQIASIPNERYISNVCADPNSGDVFVVASDITEYAYGSTTPIQTLSAPGYSLSGCSVDRVTGDLAVAITRPSGSFGGVLVFHNAQGTPVAYTETNLYLSYYCAYDDQGNLFLDSIDSTVHTVLSELPKGQTTLRDLSLDKDVGYGFKIQWDAGSLVFPASGQNGFYVYRISIHGSKAKVTARTELDKVHPGYPAFWIEGDEVVAPLGKTQKQNNQRLGIWNYPKGKNAIQGISGLTKGKKDEMNDLTISVAPSR
jgi:hypothetical protein